MYSAFACALVLSGVPRIDSTWSFVMPIRIVLSLAEDSHPARAMPRARARIMGILVFILGSIRRVSRGAGGSYNGPDAPGCPRVRIALSFRPENGTFTVGERPFPRLASRVRKYSDGRLFYKAIR